MLVSALVARLNISCERITVCSTAVVNILLAFLLPVLTQQYKGQPRSNKH